MVPAGVADGSLVERIARSRGMDSQEVRRLQAISFNDLEAPEKLFGAIEVAKRLVHAVRAGRTIAIYGDYDADGMCACAILLHVLRAVRPEKPPLIQIPLRASEGYGLSMSALKQLASSGVQTIITVDCGITAVEEAAAARELGVELLITDHHSLNADGRLPDADAICHPALAVGDVGAGDGLLCGAAVAWKVALAFAREWTGSDRVPTQLKELLVETVSLAALGTVADVVPLSGENKVIVRLGCQRMACSGLPGLRALAKQAGIKPTETVDAERISFGIAPILNACGRLGRAVDAVELLGIPSRHEANLNHDALVQRAGVIAGEFSVLNERRKDIERAIVTAAESRIEEGLASARGACVLADESWPRGVVGIACARMVDNLGVPVILLEREGDYAHGSARSIDGYSALEGLHACAHLLDRYGGHAAAAGVSLRCDRLDEFREAFSAHAAANRPQGNQQCLKPDCQLDSADLSVTSFESITQLGPFGRGFPAPTVLLRRAQICSDPRKFGSDESHLSFYVRLSQGGPELRCTWWRKAAMAPRVRRGAFIHLVARPTVDRWKGPPKAALVVMDAADSEA